MSSLTTPVAAVEAAAKVLELTKEIKELNEEIDKKLILLNGRKDVYTNTDTRKGLTDLIKMHEKILTLRAEISIENYDTGDGNGNTEGERLFLIESSAKAEIAALKERVQKHDELPAPFKVD